MDSRLDGLEVVGDLLGQSVYKPSCDEEQVRAVEEWLLRQSVVRSDLELVMQVLCPEDVARQDDGWMYKSFHASLVCTPAEVLRAIIHSVAGLFETYGGGEEDAVVRVQLWTNREGCDDAFDSSWRCSSAKDVVSWLQEDLGGNVLTGGQDALVDDPTFNTGMEVIIGGQEVFSVERATLQFLQQYRTARMRVLSEV